MSATPSPMRFERLKSARTSLKPCSACTRTATMTTQIARIVAGQAIQSAPSRRPLHLESRDGPTRRSPPEIVSLGMYPVPSTRPHWKRHDWTMQSNQGTSGPPAEHDA